MRKFLIYSGTAAARHAHGEFEAVVNRAAEIAGMSDSGFALVSEGHDAFAVSRVWRVAADGSWEYLGSDVLEDEDE